MDDYEPDDLLPEESGIIKCLDHGHVQFLDSMGSDHTICQDARQSYGKGTKTKNDDRGLIRRLMRDRHTSPFEMGEVKLHIKTPIFVARQWIRHRAASLNEYSGRYSIMPDEFHVPELHDMRPQSKTNKQGRDGELCLDARRAMRETMKQQAEMQFQVYEELTHGWPWLDEDGDKWGTGRGDGGVTNPVRHNEGRGLARELSRIGLPLSTYTMFTWKIDLHNLFHFLRLRMDPHAQWEIRVFAQAVHDLVAPRFPLCFEAFYDYQLHAATFSRHERRALATLLNELLSPDEDSRFEGLVKSEKREFAAKIAALRELA